MANGNPGPGLQLRSLIRDNGELELSLVTVETPEPGPDEIVLRMEAAPLNPSDQGLLLGAADPATARAVGSPDAPKTILTVPPHLLPAMAGRIGQSMPVGIEGAGIVVQAGTSPAAQALLGRTVATMAGGAYSQYRTVKLAECLPLPEGTSPWDAASCFVNPLTALGMVETMRLEGHKALVHTAAASNLGQMLNRICLKDGIGLVNVVRSQAQADLLRGQGATHVCDISQESFKADLLAAVTATGATLGFDAIGGGPLAGQILRAMEDAANQAASNLPYSRYGTNQHKQVYIYGRLDTRPTELKRDFGFAWGVGGWLLMPFMARLTQADLIRLQTRVASELTTTFASHYTSEISMSGILRPDAIAVFSRRATGEKFLVNPLLG